VALSTKSCSSDFLIFDEPPAAAMLPPCFLCLLFFQSYFMAVPLYSITFIFLFLIFLKS